MIKLAAKRTLKFPDGAELRTPLLLPSFSSRVPKIDSIFRTMEEVIDGPILISAYDIKHGHITAPYDWAGAIFLDSGGYEISRETDLSDISDYTLIDSAWTAEEHGEVISNWASGVPLVVVSYDHPRIRCPFDAQIESALKLIVPRGAVREILLKPETTEQHFISIGSLVKAARKLADFGVIGVTEKEIGNSVFERMSNVASLRLALEEVGLSTPIHLFGSLDSTTTLLYFVAGADIFDGLTWLRYAFKDGRTLYRHDFGITDVGVTIKAPKVEAVCWVMNYNYLQEMQREMRRFLIAHDFDVFKFHRELLKSTAENVEESVRK